MNRNATRTALVTLGLATLAACIVNLSFAMDKPNIALKTNPGLQTISEQPILVSLGDYKEITDHKDSIKSLDLDSIDITVTAVGQANTAHTVSGSVSLRKNLTDLPANDIPVGSLTAFALQQGSTKHLPGTPQLDAFLLQQLQNAGTFYVVVSGSVDSGVADVLADVNSHASIGYDTGIF